jgi:ribbon-helix-helix CopG family protein
MAMKRTNIYLDEAQARLLRHLAADQDTSFTAIVRQAINEYLERNNLDVTALVRGPLRTLPDPAWSAKMSALLDEIRAHIPPDADADEIEADITLARDEVRQLQRAQERALHD